MFDTLAEAMLQCLLELVATFIVEIIFAAICYRTGAFLIFCLSAGRLKPANTYIDQQATEKGKKKKKSWVYRYHNNKYLSVYGVSTVGFSFWIVLFVITVWVMNVYFRNA